ncbi:TAXI family TRAP transporter solute-binding subunit [Alkalicoccus chagannorensis]|uniref:TAXI family TRAP transporter solute-binding subunit n=1 Tax=Alkalicoccus chagannorensis TaxID=427072 RepID=UPI000411EE59|nr:TAXI family TRAP transporter solute-binding subunit [Alkalicoccus chagannorensis]
MKKFAMKAVYTGGVIGLAAVITGCGDNDTNNDANQADGGADNATAEENNEEDEDGNNDAPAEDDGEEVLEEGEEPDTDGDSYNFATSPQGTSVNALGNGVGSLLNSESDISTTVQPYAGINAWLPQLNDGTIAFGIDSAPDMVFAYNGDEEVGYEESHDELRLIMRGNFIQATGLAVREDSDIESVADLAGERVASDFPGATIAELISEAVLYANGMTWDDVQDAPVPSIDRGVEGLQNNQLDATFALVPSTPLMQEAHNATGLRGFDFLDDYGPDEIDDVPDDVLAEIQSRVPGAQMTTVDPDGYIAEETTAIEYPNYFISSSHIDNDTVYEVMETVWEHHEDLHDIHPWFQGWVEEQFFDEEPEIPYHDGAIEFFEDQGLWNDDVQSVQDELLSQ